MRYHFEPPLIYSAMYGETYICDHPVYSRCTLYTINGKGLAVIQQRFNEKSKSTYWDEVDPCLRDGLYLNVKFRAFFDSRAGVPRDGLYPTVTIRQAMWALKMKPLPKERWETTFDRRSI